MKSWLPGAASPGSLMRVRRKWGSRGPFRTRVVLGSWLLPSGLQRISWGVVLLVFFSRARGVERYQRSMFASEKSRTSAEEFFVMEGDGRTK